MLVTLATSIATQVLPLKTKAYEITLPTAPLSSTVNPSSISVVTQYLTTELYAVLLYIFAFVVLLYLTTRCFIFGYFLFDKMKSELAIVYDTHEASLCIKWASLPDKNRNYQMSIPSIITPQILNFYCFGVIKIDTSAWKVFNTLTGTMVKIPRWTFISPGELSCLRHSFIAGQHSVSVALIHSHQIEPVMHRPLCTEIRESVV